MTTEVDKKDLTSSPIVKTLFEMSFPMSWGILSIIGFNIVDTYFIGQLGKTHLAAISLTFPVIMFFFSLALGIGVALSSVVSRFIGEKDYTQVKQVTTTALIFSFVVVLICSFVGFHTIEPLFNLLGATKETLPIVKDYMEIWYAGMVFLAIPMVGNGAIRAKGEMTVASIIMIVSAVLNIILDPLLIFGFGSFSGYGIQGAALASVGARAVTFLASLYFLIMKFDMICLESINVSSFINSLRRILYIAIPTCASNFVAPITMGIITGLIASLGEESLATYAIVNRVESFALVFILALSSSMGPMVGQNFGAHKMKRIKKAVQTSFLMALVWGTLMAFLFTMMPKLIVKLFSDDSEVIKMGMWYFSIVPLTYGFFGMRLIVNSSLNAMGKPILGTGLTIINLFVVFLPLVFIAVNQGGLKGIFYAQAISNLLIGGLSFILINFILKKESDQHAT